MTRERLAKLANDEARGSRRGSAPVLTAASDRESVIAWLQWNDPNGCHTDALARAEDFDPYTDAAAWEALADMLADLVDVDAEGPG